MEDFRKILQSKNLSVTKPRLDILSTLKEAGEPLTIDELTKKLSLPSHTTTVYRSLRALVDSGLVYQTDFRNGAAYYEFQEHHHHHHITCTQCKTRISVNVCVKQHIPLIETDTSFSITSHLLEFFGLCSQCQILPYKK